MIVSAAAVLYAWRLGASGLSTYYAASVKSMLTNPRAVFFGALDPDATSTLDKLAGFLIPQALSAKIFGFEPWALSLPQAIEGVVTVLASYVVGTRWRGVRFGLSTAGLMAFTPMLAAMFGRPMEDGLLTMCMVLAFAAWQRALIQNSVVWLSVSGMWVAVGFQAKMLQAWLILPALLIAYLIASPLPIRRRVGQLAIAGAVTLILSLSWMTAIALVPPSQRPYIDGTTSNNTYSMVFGYNGVDRIIPGLIPGAVAQLGASPGSGQSGVNTIATSNAGMSPFKLLMPQFTTQMGWLYPAALAGCLLEILALRKRWTHRGGVGLALVLSLAFTGLVMSVAFVPHATYLAVLTLPLSALAVAGAWSSIRLYRHRSAAWVALPILVVAQTLWASLVSLEAAIQMRWLMPIILVVGLGAALALVLLHVRPSAGAVALRTALAGAIAAALIGPIAWSLCVLGPGGGGSASDAFAGPRLNSGLVPPPPPKSRSDSGLDAAQQRLVHYVESKNTPNTIAFATDTMAIAVRVILTTHENPIAMGGFSRQAPTPALATLRELITSGRLRFVLLAVDAPGQPAPENPVVASDRSWVRTNCRAVLSGQFRDGKSARQTLFDCGAHPLSSALSTSSRNVHQPVPQTGVDGSVPVDRTFSWAS
jgi:4-amino-4-deoxy-L-arabinose transferase-like glycosyltransferase